MKPSCRDRVTAIIFKYIYLFLAHMVEIFVVSRAQTLYDQPLLVRWAKQHEMEEILNCKLAEHQVMVIFARLYFL